MMNSEFVQQSSLSECEGILKNLKDSCSDDCGFDDTDGSGKGDYKFKVTVEGKDYYLTHEESEDEDEEDGKEKVKSRARRCASLEKTDENDNHKNDRKWMGGGCFPNIKLYRLKIFKKLKNDKKKGQCAKCKQRVQLKPWINDKDQSYKFTVNSLTDTAKTTFTFTFTTEKNETYYLAVDRDLSRESECTHICTEKVPGDGAKPPENARWTPNDDTYESQLKRNFFLCALKDEDKRHGGRETGYKLCVKHFDSYEQVPEYGKFCLFPAQD